MTTTVTMLQTRQGEGGSLWTVGNSYAASDAFATVLINSNYATGTLPISRGLVPVNAQTDSNGQITALVDADGDALINYLVSAGGGDFAAMVAQANAEIVANGKPGIITLANSQYELSAPLNLDSAYVGLNGSGSIISVAALGSGVAGINLYSSIGGSDANRYPQPLEVANLTIQGAESDGRNAVQYGVRANSTVASSSVRTTLRNVRMRWLNRGISIGNRAYFLKGYGVEIGSTRFGLYQESGVTDFVENISFYGGVIFSSDCLVKILASQRLRMYGMSFDYFGEATTANDQLFAIEAGGALELYGCHLEFSYGQSASQSRAPINITGASGSFLMVGGKIIYTGTRSATYPLWKALVATDNLTQTVIMENISCKNLGRVGDPYHDDALVTGAASDNTGDGANVRLRNLHSVDGVVSDLPSVGSYYLRSNETISGVSAPHTELVHRIAVTGTAVVASVTSPQGSIYARNTTGAMMSILNSGAAAGSKVLISFDQVEALRRRAWSLFLNGGSFVGSVTVRVRMSTAVPVWNGTTVVQQADARASYTPTTVTITGGTNEWRRVSWKDVETSPWPSSRQCCDVFTIEIDTSGITSGTLYLDDIAVGMM